MREEETARKVPEEAPGPQVGATADSDAAMASEISLRVGSILDSVEHEAARLREDARAEAARYSDAARRRADDLVEERRRRIAEISDELVTKSEAVVSRLDDAAPVRSGFENLVHALADAAERLARESEGGAEAFRPPPFHEATVSAAAHEPPVPPPPGFAERQPHPARTPVATVDLDEALMVAVEMASTGSTRAEVRGHLNGSPSVPDPEGALDQIFGAGTAEDARVSWAIGTR